MSGVEQIARLIAWGFGSGLLGKAPGTAGSAAFVLVWLILSRIFGPSLETNLFIFLVILLLASWSCRTYMQRDQLPHSDPQEIVIDEWLGMSCCLMPVSQLEALPILAAFVLFRLFDITKPGPVGWLENLPGFWGVLADDLAAGALGAVTLVALGYLFDGFIA